MHPTPKPYHYEYRREYGDNPQNFLITFNCTSKSVDDLMSAIFGVLKEMGFTTESADEMWMNDEVWVWFSSPNGKVLVTRDVWDLVFIMGSKNQTDKNE